jgi:hypothetical protein
MIPSKFVYILRPLRSPDSVSPPLLSCLLLLLSTQERGVLCPSPLRFPCTYSPWSSLHSALALPSARMENSRLLKELRARSARLIASGLPRSPSLQELESDKRSGVTVELVDGKLNHMVGTIQGTSRKRLSASRPHSLSQAPARRRTREASSSSTSGCQQSTRLSRQRRERRRGRLAVSRNSSLTRRRL